MNSYDVPSQRCPHCSTELDMATNVDGESRPSPGDFTVCLKCRGLLRFDYALGVYAPSPDEVKELSLANVKRIAEVRYAITAMRAQQN